MTLARKSPNTTLFVSPLLFNVLDLHFQQRTTRKCLTLVQGLPEDLDMPKIVRQFKKAWCCNGTTHEHD